MNLIAAPARQFKTVSMWLLIAAGLFDLGIVLVQSLSDLHVISTQTLGIINAALAFITGAVRFIQQQIALTTEQKVDLVQSAAAQPVHPGQDDIGVVVVPKETP